MWLLYAEAFGAMLILILIVWWTMFHGRRRGEPAEERIERDRLRADRLEADRLKD